MLTAPRWTHVALPSGDIEASVDWYTTFTPLVVLDRREDEDGRNAWLSHAGPTAHPFVLVLVMFYADQGTKQPQLAPFAHLGIEVPRRADVDRIAEMARADGCLTWEPRQMPPPIGYICALSDPDGNVVEISHDQGVYARAEEVWGPDAAGVGGPERVVRSYLAAFAEADPDRIADHVSDDFVDEDPARGATRGRAEHRADLATFLAEVSGPCYEVEDLVAADDRVAVAYRMTARRVRPDGTAHPVEIRAMARFRVRDGRIVHRADYGPGRDGLPPPR